MMARKTAADKQTNKRATEDRCERDETYNATNHLSNDAPGPALRNFNAKQKESVFAVKKRATPPDESMCDFNQRSAHRIEWDPDQTGEWIVQLLNQIDSTCNS